METDRRPLIYILLIAIVVIAVGWTYSAKKKAALVAEQATEEVPVVSNLSNLKPTDFDAGVKNEYALAVAKAIEANPEHKIAQIEVNLESDLLPESVSSRYIFAAENQPSANWMITITATNQNYIRALVPKADYAGEIIPFDTALWKYNYVTALQLAEKMGGLEWRESNDLSSVQLRLKKTGINDVLAWTVEYQNDTDTKTIVLDAATGQELEE